MRWPIFLVILDSLAVFAQAPDWQTAAGGKLSFEVASVKPTNRPSPPTFSLDPGNAKPAGGRFSASFPLSAFIEFAYKLQPGEAEPALAKSEKWARSGLFDIEAKAEGNPTKDQMRLMMQSLLAERFKLAIHFETHVVPVFALTLVKPGKTGPKLHPHSAGPPCPDSYALPTPAEITSSKAVFPPVCGAALSWGKPNAMWLVGGRNITLAYLASSIFSYGRMAGDVDKPVVDQTGLKGTFDFTIEYNFKLPPVGPPGADAQPRDSQGPTFLEALHKQLGLKFESTKGPQQTLVIDHVERPSEN
jgi:bla regulator protein BlaR1